MGFPTKNDHFGVFFGVPPFKETPVCGPVGEAAWSCLHNNLVGGFNPSEKYSSNWIISPHRDEHKKYLKAPPSNYNSSVILGLVIGQNSRWERFPKNNFLPNSLTKKNNTTLLTPIKCAPRKIKKNKCEKKHCAKNELPSPWISPKTSL